MGGGWPRVGFGINSVACSGSAMPVTDSVNYLSPLPHFSNQK
jgi:hypothetical protein